MSNQAVIVQQLPGVQVAEAYLKIVRTKCPTGFGFAGQMDGKLVVETAVVMPTVEDLTELCKSFKDGHLVMYFGNLPNAELPEDIQPWTFNDGHDGPEQRRHWLALFFEGGFEKYYGLNGKHTGEYCVSDEIIFPKLGRIFEDCGGVDESIPTFFQKLTDESVQKAFKINAQDRSTFVMLGETGDPVAFGDNTIGGSYAWGNTSNAFDYSEKPITSGTPAIVPAKAGRMYFLNRSSKSSTSVSSGVTAPPVPTTPPPAPDTGAPRPDAPHPDADPNRKVVNKPTPVELPPGQTTKVVDGVTYKLMGPPGKLFSHNKAWNLWLRTFNKGDIPANHQSKECKVWVVEDLVELAQSEVAHKDDVGRLASKVHELRSKKTNVAAATMAGKEDKPITGKFPDAPKPKAADYLPVMPDSDKEKYQGQIAGYLAKGKRPTPLELQKMESKWKTFSEDTGTRFDENMTLSVLELKEMFGDGAAMFIIELRHKLLAAGYKPEVGSEGTNADEAKVDPKTLAPAPKTGGRMAFLNRKTG